MVKSQYFCDRCAAEVTNTGGRFALYKVTIPQPNGNPVYRDVCRLCAAEIGDFVSKPIPDPTP